MLMYKEEQWVLLPKVTMVFILMVLLLNIMTKNLVFLIPPLVEEEFGINA
jgi:hypothetical protein